MGIKPNTPERIPLYMTDEHPCSYLDTEMARTAFIDPSFRVSKPIYSSLNQQGFRRSGDFFYRPQCKACDRCKPLRIPAASFQPSRSQRRNLKKNSDIVAVIKSDPDIWEYYGLYRRYLKSRHADGDMYPPDPTQYESFIGSRSDCVRYVEYYLDQQLVMVSVMDRLPDALSAVYTFFDPEYAHRGLGNFAVLWQISQAKEMAIPYLYLGFWIEASPKMNYKTQYRPYEILLDQRWQAPKTQEKTEES